MFIADNDAYRAIDKLRRAVRTGEHALAGDDAMVMVSRDALALLVDTAKMPLKTIDDASGRSDAQRWQK